MTKMNHIFRSSYLSIVGATGLRFYDHGRGCPAADPEQRRPPDTTLSPHAIPFDTKLRFSCLWLCPPSSHRGDDADDACGDYNLLYLDIIGIRSKCGWLFIRFRYILLAIPMFWLNYRQVEASTGTIKGLLSGCGGWRYLSVRHTASVCLSLDEWGNDCCASVPTLCTLPPAHNIQCMMGLHFISLSKARVNIREFVVYIPEVHVWRKGGCGGGVWLWSVVAVRRKPFGFLVSTF